MVATLAGGLRRAAHQVAVWIETSLREEGLSAAEAGVLAFIVLHGETSINDVHRHFGHRRSTLTSIVDRLESKGLVRRTLHRSSRRSVSLELTGEGEAAGNDVVELMEWLEAEVRRRVTSVDLTGFLRVTIVIGEITGELGRER